MNVQLILANGRQQQSTVLPSATGAISIGTHAAANRGRNAGDVFGTGRSAYPLKVSLFTGWLMILIANFFY